MHKQAILALACIISFDVVAHGEPPRRAMTFFDYITERGDTFVMSVCVPIRALCPRTIEEWATILNASEAQRRFMLLEYEQFAEKHNAFVEREAPGYIDRGKEMWSIRERREHMTWDYYELSRTMDRNSARLRRELTAMEHAFIDRLLPVLTPEQQVWIPIVKNEATRRNCRVPLLSKMRWTDVELRPLWHASGASPATPEEQRRVDAILADYEARLTRQICRMADLRLETRARLQFSGIARSRLEMSSAEGRAQYEAARDEQIAVYRRAQLINEQAVERIASAVSAEAAGVFVRAARAAAYPELYPDTAALHDLLAALQSDDLLDERQQVLVRVITHEYQAQYDRICRDLEAYCEEWSEQDTRNFNELIGRSLADELEPMLEERKELSKRWLITMRDSLGREVLDRHSSLIPRPLRSEVSTFAGEVQRSPEAVPSR